ncbi:hypothetical protein [Megasphaera sp. UPII 135-E]|nr:hypothetical protein [Megasphaera sp. UPII 135-E]
MGKRRIGCCVGTDGNILSGASFTGNAEALASWVEAHAGQADAMYLKW